MLARFIALTAVAVVLGCASGAPTPVPRTSPPIAGIYAFDNILFDFNRGRARIVYRVEGLVDCSSDLTFCFDGPSDVRAVFPRNCSDIASEYWSQGGLTTRVVARDPDTGDAILMTDGAPRALFQYNRLQGVVGIYYDPSAQPMFERGAGPEVLRSAREIGAYHPRTSFDFLFRCS